MTQGIGKVPMSLNDVDLASISAHKIYGPKGIGLLYKKESIKIKQLMYGTKDDFRPGTPALPLIASFSKALRIALNDLAKKEEKIKKLNLKIVETLEKYPHILINKTKYTIPHILNFSLMKIKPETFIHAMAKQNIYLSSNTACSSNEISAAVLNLYQDKKRALSTIRVSISYLTKNEEINSFLKTFNKVYSKLMELKDV